MAVNWIPEGYGVVTPFITVDDAGEFIAFVEKTFGGKVRFRIDAPGQGSVTPRSK